MTKIQAKSSVTAVIRSIEVESKYREVDFGQFFWYLVELLLHQLSIYRKFLLCEE